MSDKSLRLRVLLDAVDKVTAPLKRIGGGAAKASKQLAETRDRLKALEAVQKDLAEFRGLRQGLDQTTAALAAQQRQTQELAAKYAALEKPTRRQTRELEKARKAVTDLKASQQSQIRDLQELRGRLSSAGIAAGDMSAAERRLRTDIGKTNGEIREQEDKLKRLNAQRDRVGKAKAGLNVARDRAGALAGGGATAMAVGAAVIAPTAFASKEAMTFEESMADIRKVVDFPTPKAFVAMRRDLLDLADVIPMPKEELAAIAAQAGQAGIARTELKAFTRDAAQMGVAFDIAGGEAGEMMSKWRTAFQLTQPEVVALGDRINYLGNTGPAKAKQISEVVTRIGALGEVAGLSSAQIAALGATVVAQGVETEIAATGIKNTMLALTKGEAATKAQKQAYDDLGLSATAVAKAMQEDAGAAIVDVMKRIQGLSKERQASVLTQLFGSESVAAIAPLLTNMALLEKNLNKVADATLYTGAMQKEFQGRVETTASGVQMAKNNIGGLATEIGFFLLPQIKAVGEMVGGAARSFRQWTQDHPKLAKVVVYTTAVLGGLIAILGAVAVAVAAIMVPWAILNAAFIASPIGWVVLGIVVAIGALIAIAALVIANWKPITAFFMGLWDSIKSIVVGAVAILIKAFMNFTPAGLLLQAFLKAWPVLRDAGVKFAAMGADLIMGLVGGITGKLGAIKNAIVGAAKSAIGWFKDALGIRSPSRVFAGLGGFTMAGLADGLRKGERQPLDQIRATAGRLTKAMAVGASLAATGTLPAGAMSAPASAGAAAQGGGDTYHFDINVPAGADAKAIAAEVRRVLEQIAREKAARGRSNLGDDED